MRSIRSLLAAVACLFVTAAEPVSPGSLDADRLHGDAEGGVVGAAASTDPAPVAFARAYVDTTYGGNGRPGWVRAGDLDRDGDLDLVAGGGRAIFLYENDGGRPSAWPRHGSRVVGAENHGVDPTGRIGANGVELYDVDDDGDLDIVSAMVNDDLGWWENPGGDLDATPWSFHEIAAESCFLTDVLRGDLDGDGVAEEFVFNAGCGNYWNTEIKLRWLKPGSDPAKPWEAHVIEPSRSEGEAHGHAGLDLADIDRDGNPDLVYANGWYEAPDDPTGSWVWHEVTTIYGISNALARDMNDDGRVDLVVSAGHHGSGVYWIEAPRDPRRMPWREHEVDSGIVHPECLAVDDLDFDGDLDVVSCDLDFDRWDLEVHNLYFVENHGDSFHWTTHNVSPNGYGNHQLQLVDMNGDGRKEIISEATGFKVVSLYERRKPRPIAAPPEPETPVATSKNP
jgi:hypothetical protein